jgi:hypothetical protein
MSLAGRLRLAAHLSAGARPVDELPRAPAARRARRPDIVAALLGLGTTMTRCPAPLGSSIPPVGPLTFCTAATSHVPFRRSATIVMATKSLLSRRAVAICVSLNRPAVVVVGDVLETPNLAPRRAASRRRPFSAAKVTGCMERVATLAFRSNPCEVAGSRP